MKGSIRDSSLAEIFLKLYRQKREGILHVTSGGRIKVFYIKDGEIKQGVSNEKEENPINVLIEHGFISQNAFESLKNRPGEFESVLQNAGILTKTDLRKAFELRIEKMISSLLNWEDGEFFFFDDRLPSYLGEEGVSIKNVIRKAIYGISDRKKLLHYLPDLETPLSTIPFPVEDLDEREKKVLSTFLSPKKIRDALNELPYDEFHSLKVIFFLKIMGLLQEETSLPQESQFVAEEKPETIEPVESNLKEREMFAEVSASSGRKEKWISKKLLFPVLLLVIIVAGMKLFFDFYPFDTSSRISLIPFKSKQAERNSPFLQEERKQAKEKTERIVKEKVLKELSEISKKDEKKTKTAQISPQQLLMQGRYAEAASLWKKSLVGKKGFTLFLELDCKEESIKYALRFADVEKLFLLPYKFKGRNCFRLCWGIFASEKEAEKEMKKLPSHFLKQGVKIFPLPVMVGQ